MSTIVGKVTAALAFASLLTGCRASDPRLYPCPPADTPADVVVLDNHWHTALIFRTADLPRSFQNDLRVFAGRQYVAVGWGDEGFFRAEHITPALVAQALFYSRGSVMLVFAFDSLPEETFGDDVDIYRIPASRTGLNRTTDAVAATFRRQGGDVIDAGPGINGGRFYTANGRYAFYHTCNQWTADMMAAGGMPVTGAYAGFAANLAFQLRRLDGVRRNGQNITVRRPAPSPVVRNGRGLG